MSEEIAAALRRAAEALGFQVENIRRWDVGGLLGDYLVEVQASEGLTFPVWVENINEAPDVDLDRVKARAAVAIAGSRELATMKLLEAVRGLVDQVKALVERVRTHDRAARPSDMDSRTDSGS